MFAYDIELDYTISNFAIESNLTLPGGGVCMVQAVILIKVLVLYVMKTFRQHNHWYCG